MITPFILTIAALFLTRPLFGAAIIINGGPTDDSNYSTHEEDILAFSEFLGTSTKILNYKGKKSVVVPVESNGEFKRDSYGWIQTEPTKVPNAEPATLSTIGRAFFEMASKEPPTLTVIYSDHGDRNGIAIGEDFLSHTGVQYQYGLLPKTMIRAVHLHCYAKHTMINPS